MGFLFHLWSHLIPLSRCYVLAGSWTWLSVVIFSPVVGLPGEICYTATEEEHTSIHRGETKNISSTLMQKRKMTFLYISASAFSS